MKTRLKALASTLTAAPIRKTSRMLACLGISVSVASSCGILGDKEKNKTELSQGDTACLDELGPLTEKFIEGEVSESKWKSTWECVDDTLSLFKDYVRGAEEGGYSANDLRLLAQRFLFSKKTVTAGLIDGALNVKASLFGGTSARLSSSELEQFRALARFLKDETSRLIPHLQNRKLRPTAQNLRAFADALDGFGERLADFLKSENYATLTTEKAVQFMNELSAVSVKADPEKLSQWTRALQETKVLLVRGDANGFAGKDWSKVIRFGFRAGGAFFAYLDSDGADPRFEIEMAERIQAVLKDSLKEWGGEFPYAQITRIVDQVPTENFPGIAEEFRKGVKQAMLPRSATVAGKNVTLRPAFSRLLLSKSDTGIDANSLDRMMEIFRSGWNARYHLDAIYAGRASEMTAAEFETAAKKYSSGRSKLDQDQVARLITIAQRYLAYHPEEGKEMVFAGDLNRHTKSNLGKMSWYELAASTLLEGYGSRQNAYGKAGSIDDLEQLVGDVNPILNSLRMIHPLRTQVAQKRFREANLFTQAGNGDDLMDLPETAIYFAILFSSDALSNRITDLSLVGSNPCPDLGWNVPLRMKVYDIQCFRQRFVQNIREIFTNMPKMQDSYEAMNASQKDEFYRALENAGKGTGYDPTPITTYDLSSFGGIPHFVESAFQKFDRNRDGTLDRSETLDVAFPVFKRELSTISKIKIDFVNKAVLLYLMQYGEEPKVGDLLKWAISFQFLKKFNAPRIRVYQIFSTLSPPVAADPISQTPPAGALDFFTDSLQRGLTPFVSDTNRAPAALTAAAVAAAPANSGFDLSKVDPTQLQGYPAGGPVIDPTSPHVDALSSLPQDL